MTKRKSGQLKKIIDRQEDFLEEISRRMAVLIATILAFGLAIILGLWLLKEHIDNNKPDVQEVGISSSSGGVEGKPIPAEPANRPKKDNPNG